MPRYSIHPGDGWEAVPFERASVLDANGAAVSRWILRCDTDTGWCEVLDEGDDGRPILDRETREWLRHWEKHPAPLRLVPAT